MVRHLPHDCEIDANPSNVTRSSVLSRAGRALSENGYCVLRNAVPAPQVARYRDAIDAIHKRFLEEPERFNAEEVAQIGHGDIPPHPLSLFGLRLETFFDFPHLEPFLRKWLIQFEHYNFSLISTSALPGRFAENRIGLHTDGVIQGTQEYVVSFWSPLQPCGRDAPGLAIIPASRRQVVAYLRKSLPDKRIPGWHSAEEWNATDTFNPKKLERHFSLLVAPELCPGDIVAFTNWTIHGTHVTSAMTGRRSAIVMRWRQIGSKWGRLKVKLGLDTERR
jgi:ectoine hydroxylase-related dioxygenase (phytanoyl-CoA dioxygenase family)